MKRAIAALVALAAIGASTAVAYIGCPSESAAQPVRLGPKAPKSTESIALAAALEEVGARADEGQGAAYLELNRSWSGRTVRWEGAYLPPMCRMPSACALAAFDRAKLDHPVMQGWMARLSLAPAEHAKLLAECEDKAHCVVEYEGRINVRASPATFTQVELDEVHVLGAREARAGEHWFGTPR